MKIIEHTDIDLKKWDEKILSSEMPLVFAQSFYLNATSPGWAALVEGNYETVMPLTVKRKFSITYLIQPPFTPSLGLFGKFDKKIIENFLKYLENTYKYISIELNPANFLSDSKIDQKRTFVIDLEKDFTCNSNTKRNIAKALKSNLKIQDVTGAEILAINKKYLHPFLKNKLKIVPAQIKLFDQLLINAQDKGYLKTFTVTDNKEKLCAVAHFISNGKHALYLKGNNFDKAANSGSMHFLMQHAIEHYKTKNVRLFDFGGGQNDSLARFFSGFGAKEINYRIFKFNNLPKAIKWLKK